MLSTNDIKYIRSLQQKKFRQKYNNFVVEGDKIVQEVLHSAETKVEKIYALEQWLEEYASLIDTRKIATQVVSEKVLGRISGLRSPNQVLAVLSHQAYPLFEPAPADDWALYLDRIQDPGNFGTILRIADWFGIPYVFCSADCVELYNPKVLQASMGAFIRVRTIYTDFDQIVNYMDGLPICGSVLEGKNIYTHDRPDKGLLVIGNESRGISQAIMEQLDERWQIPGVSGAGAESLNAAVACGIICGLLRNG